MVRYLIIRGYRDQRFKATFNEILLRDETKIFGNVMSLNYLLVSKIIFSYFEQFEDMTMQNILPQSAISM